MARVYILGAGASCFAGYPLAKKLWPFVRDRSPGDVVADQRRQAVIKEMERIIMRFPPKVYDEPDLEELFTFLDLSLLTPDVFQLGHADWQSMRPQMVGMIADAFMNYQHDLQGYLYSGGKAPQGVDVDRGTTVKVLDAWATIVVEGDVLVSFNWDLLHDVTLHRGGKWLCGDGYGFRSQQATVARSSPVKLYKLHGSANWAQAGTDEEPAILYSTVFFGDPRDDEDYMKEVGWDQGRKSMVIPSYLKFLGPNPTLVRIWNKAGEALRNAEEVVVIGYGLHRADSLAHHLFMSSLLDNPHRPSIEIVAPVGSPDNWDDLCLALGLKRKRTRTNFEDWLLGAGTSPRRTP